MKKESCNIFWFEKELIKRCNLSQNRFHKVRNDSWEKIYHIIVEKYADKTKIWKNGLHWANTNGYSPKSMKNFQGCYTVVYSAWFHDLPQIIAGDEMVYFLIDRGSDWYFGECFWIFECYIPELIKVLDLLNQTAFLNTGWSDYYLVSKKYLWLIGFNHHDVVSCVGEGLNLECFKRKD